MIPIGRCGRFWELYDPVEIDMPALAPSTPRNPVEQSMYELYDRGEIPISAEDVRRAHDAPITP